MPDEIKFRALTDEDWRGVDTRELKAEGGLSLKQGIKDGCYTSIQLDSGIPGCRWHRIVLDADIPENSTISISLYTSEQKETGRDCSSENWLKQVVFKRDAREALVNAPPGKYISLRIEFHREGKDPPILKKLKVYYQRLSYLRYLPAVYQENKKSREFLEKYLSIFESSLYDSEEEISGIPIYFDPDATPEEFYRWLAGWLSLDLYDLLGERNREFILRAVEFYRKKGTLPGIASLVNFLTGKRCCVKEYMNNVFRSYGMEHENAVEAVDEKGCMRTYHKISKTFDKATSADIVSKIGTFEDELYYVIDTRRNGRYCQNVIGIFIFVPSIEEELIIKPEQLLKIINSFLPVFVRPIIEIVEEFHEEFYLSSIVEIWDEKLTNVSGNFIDEADWELLYSYTPAKIVDYRNDPSYRRTNQKGYRTRHIGIKSLEEDPWLPA